MILGAHNPAEMAAGRGHHAALSFTPEELATQLDPQEWEPLVLDARPRQTRTPEGQEVTIRDAILVARRV